jgi:hypothetical protein
MSTGDAGLHHGQNRNGQREPFCYNRRLNQAKSSDSTYLDQSERRDESGDPEDFSVDG